MSTINASPSATSPRLPAPPGSIRPTRLAIAAMLAAGALAVSGCASYGYPGGYGGQPGAYGSGAYGGYGGQYANQVVGTVVGVDRGYNRIILAVDQGYGGRGEQVAVQYDGRTRLVYRGRQYPVEGLERGDVIRVDAATSGGRLYARSVEVLRNVRESGGYQGGGYGQPPYYGGGSYGQAAQEFRGRIVFVDPRARLIRIDGAGYGGRSGDIHYLPDATVRWEGSNHPARNLDPGDVIRVQARRSGNGWVAERIWMEANRGR